MNLSIQMHDPVGQLFDEIRCRNVPQASVAITYAVIMAQLGDTAPWLEINRAIQARWPSKTGLDRVKAMAWKHIDYWEQRKGAEKRSRMSTARSYPAPEETEVSTLGEDLDRVAKLAIAIKEERDTLKEINAELLETLRRITDLADSPDCDRIVVRNLALAASAKAEGRL